MSSSCKKWKPRDTFGRGSAPSMLPLAHRRLFCIDTRTLCQSYRHSILKNNGGRMVSINNASKFQQHATKKENQIARQTVRRSLSTNQHRNRHSPHTQAHYIDVTQESIHAINSKHPKWCVNLTRTLIDLNSPHPRWSLNQTVGQSSSGTKVSFQYLTDAHQQLNETARGALNH